AGSRPTTRSGSPARSSTPRAASEGADRSPRAAGPARRWPTLRIHGLDTRPGKTYVRPRRGVRPMKLSPHQSPSARLARALLAAAVALALLAGVGPFPRARAANLCVNHTGANGCYTTIQAAIVHANPNDTIAVAAGT